MAYLFAPKTLLADLHKTIQTVKTTANARQNGVPTRHAVFGVQPRDPNRNNYCRFTRDSAAQKKTFNVLTATLEYFAEQYEKLFPQSYAAARAEVQAIDKSYHFNKSPFLSINVNMNHAIKYHRDNANLLDALSTVLIVRKDISGGELVLPEINITLAQQDGAFALLPGVTLIHGVLPFIQAPKGYRASIVFYTMAGMKNCYPYKDELKRIQHLSVEKFYKQKTPEQLDSLRAASTRLLAARKLKKGEKLP